MSANIVLGAQWGDEGKGKMTDYLAEEANVVVRFQGGNNAGHTVEVGENQYKLHLIPSGILHDDKLNVLGNGVVIDPKALFTEIDYLENLGIKVSPEKLAISDRANIIMPYHRELDRLKEIARGKDSIGTTGKGIGPCYTDKVERSGIRVCDILQPEVLKEKLQNTLETKNKMIKNVYGGEEIDFNQVYEEYIEFGKKMKPFVKETSVIVYDAIKGDKNVLFEGAQGTLLDIDYGTYPYVTSSNTTAGGVCNGTGVGPTLIQNALGIAKAYTTRVGKGPFPTELTGEMGEHIRTVGHEYGVTTGRSRRCGWLDLVIVKSAVRISGLTSLAITKIDTIAGIEKIKICVGYKLGDEVIDYFPASLYDLAQCEPVYIEMDGWDDSVADARSFDELHENAKAYIRKIEEIAGVKVSIVSVGPKRSQTIRVHEEL